jgi:hypothetical protein
LEIARVRKKHKYNQRPPFYIDLWAHIKPLDLLDQKNSNYIESY